MATKKQRKTLYKCFTEVTGYIYIVANDPTEARDEIENRLEKSEYGFRKDRLVTTIEVVAIEQRRNFDDDNRDYSFTQDQPIVIIL